MSKFGFERGDLVKFTRAVKTVVALCPNDHFGWAVECIENNNFATLAGFGNPDRTMIVLDANVVIQGSNNVKVMCNQTGELFVTSLAWIKKVHDRWN